MAHVNPLSLSLFLLSSDIALPRPYLREFWDDETFEELTIIDQAYLTHLSVESLVN